MAHVCSLLWAIHPDISQLTSWLVSVYVKGLSQLLLTRCFVVDMGWACASMGKKVALMTPPPQPQLRLEA